MPFPYLVPLDFIAYFEAPAPTKPVVNAPRNFKLTSDNDLDLSSGNIQILHGADSIPQALRLRLAFFKGEWFLDRSAGVPFFQDVLKKVPDPNVLQSVFRRAILETPGVIELVDLKLSQDSVTRSLNLAFSARTDAGVLNVTTRF